MDENKVNNGPVEQEIDLVEIIKKVWGQRKFILKITAIFICFGILVALFSGKEYTANSTLVPQTGEKNAMGGLGGLAAMAGINLNNVGGNEVLSPKIYPKVLESIPFQKELMQTEIKFEEYEHPVKLIDFYTSEEYRKFSLTGVILKYTIGLPGVIMEAIRGEEPEMKYEKNAADGIVVGTLSKDESECIKMLKSKIALNVNDKEGYVTIAAMMHEPLAAAQLAAKVQVMLQRYITEFKIAKVKANLEFVEERFLEAKEQFEKKQDELAGFRDANRGFASAVARTTEERLNNEYNLAFSVYNELAKQREQANIQVKENTPIFTVVDPVTIPTERSKPKRGLICIAFAFLGGFAGIGLVLLSPFIIQIAGNSRRLRWLPGNK